MAGDLRRRGFSWPQDDFGQETSGPRFVLYRTDCGSFERYVKSSDFLGRGQQERNQALWHRVRALPPDDKSVYIARNGLNRGTASGPIMRFGQLRIGSERSNT